MALLQIAEPGQSSAPHQHKLAIGIDLGTTNSLVASVMSGQSKILKDQTGRGLLPSVVHYGDQQILTGYDAQKLSISDPLNTISSAKRLIGRSFDEIDLQQYPLKLSQTDVGVTVINTRQGRVNPIQVSSEILKSLALRAEQSLGGQASGMVLTVPAYFDDAQRQSTKDAAKLAGVHVLRLLNEPTAAAIAYGLDSGQEGVIAVYDLGGGTFDISILRLNRGIFEVLSTGGNTALGGDDFDHLLANKILELSGVESKLSASDQRALLREANRIKVCLSDVESCDYKLSLSIAECKGQISRHLFEEIIQPLIKQSLRASRRAIKDAGAELEDIIEVVMVGGSTRTPLVRSMVSDFFKRPVLTSINPDEVVAIGAALQADILVGNKPDSELLLLDITPLSLGIETMGGLSEKIIPRNTTLPVARAQEFTTFKDGQTAMSIHVVQGERELVSHCRSLAKFNLTGIPPMTAGAAHIRVTFQVDADGLLSVTAMEKSSGVAADIQVKPSFGLDESEISQMLKDSMANANADISARMLAEQQVDAKRLIESLQSALHENGQSLLNEAQYTEIDNALVELERLALSSDKEAIESGIKKLDEVSQDFASLRMDVSVSQVLSGQRLDNIDDNVSSESCIKK